MTEMVEGVRAAVWDGDRLVVDDVALVAPGPGEVTVRVLASGICHSDLNVLDGTSPVPAPVVLGHEAAGVVERVGEGVAGWAAGDPVMVSTMTPCGACPSCLAGRPSRCPATYATPRHRFRWRGQEVRTYANCSSFATHVTVLASQLVATFELPAAGAALIGCAVSTGWGAVHKVAQVVPGERVVVLGVGGIGVNAIAAARAAGAASVVAVDVDAAKGQAARRFGADEFVTDAATVGRADVVVECSGAPSAIAAAIELAPTVALVGIPPAGAELRTNARSLVLGRRLLGSLNGDVDPQLDLPLIVDAARSGDVDLAGQVSATWPLDHVHDAIAAVRAGQVIRAVLDLR